MEMLLELILAMSAGAASLIFEKATFLLPFCYTIHTGADLNKHLLG